MGHRHRTAALTLSQKPTAPIKITTTITDTRHRAHQRSHHRPAEGVGTDLADQYPICIRNPVESLQIADGGGAITTPTEGGKIIEPQQCCGSFVHPVQVEWMPPGRGSSGDDGFSAKARIGQPIPVVPTQRRESRVKVVTDNLDILDADVIGQHLGQPPHQRGGISTNGTCLQCRSGDIGVAHLSAGMHSGVGASGNGQPNRQAQHRREPILERLTDRPLPDLTSPSSEIGSVVTDVEPQSNRRFAQLGVGVLGSDKPAVT